MRISMTKREWTRVRVAVYFATVAVLGFLLISARSFDHRSLLSGEVFASAAHHSDIQVNRGSVRVERARQRTTPGSAFLPVTTDHVPKGDGSRYNLFEPFRPRPLDPIAVQSGRSPPPALS